MFALCSWEQHVGQHFEEKCCWQAFGPLGILSEQFFHWDWCGCLLTTLPFLSLPVYSCISSQPAPLILVHCHSQNDKPMVSVSQTILLWSSWVESHNFSPFHLEKKSYLLSFAPEMQQPSVQVTGWNWNSLLLNSMISADVSCTTHSLMYFFWMLVGWSCCIWL